MTALAIKVTFINILLLDNIDLVNSLSSLRFKIFTESVVKHLPIGQNSLT